MPGPTHHSPTPGKSGLFIQSRVQPPPVLYVKRVMAKLSIPNL